MADINHCSFTVQFGVHHCGAIGVVAERSEKNECRELITTRGLRQFNPYNPHFLVFIYFNFEVMIVQEFLWNQKRFGG